MAGLVGTALMLAECSRIGMLIDPERVPRPAGVDLARWLASFPSFGFLLTAEPDAAAAVVAAFAARGIACATIGRCEPGSRVELLEAGARQLFWDHDAQTLMGCDG